MHDVKLVAQTFQVTFSDGSNPSRRFDEIGQYSSLELAKESATKFLQNFYGKDLAAIKQVPDEDFAHSEDWYIDALNRPHKGIVSINCLPMVPLRVSRKLPYDSMGQGLVDAFAQIDVESA
jgi:hypothetical protein